MILSGIYPFVSRISFKSEANFQRSISSTPFEFKLVSECFIVNDSSSCCFLIFLFDPVFLLFLLRFFKVSVSPPKLPQFSYKHDFEAVEIFLRFLRFSVVLKICSRIRVDCLGRSARKEKSSSIPFHPS